MASTLTIVLTSGAVPALTISADSARRIAETARLNLQNSLGVAVALSSTTIA